VRGLPSDISRYSVVGSEKEMLLSPGSSFEEKSVVGLGGSQGLFWKDMGEDCVVADRFQLITALRRPNAAVANTKP
jgi:hypothetical protein